MRVAFGYLKRVIVTLGLGETRAYPHTYLTLTFQSYLQIVLGLLLNEKKNSDKRIEAKFAIRKNIQHWLPYDFFEYLDDCGNATVLNYYAHRKYKSFDWFDTMETGIDGKNIYKAMQWKKIDY
jgi:hypothetical protein